jgi:hypothetical protein
MQRAHLFFDQGCRLRVPAGQKFLIALGADRAERHRVDADAMGTIINRQGAGQPLNGSLGGRIGQRSPNGPLRLMGRYIDDRPTGTRPGTGAPPPRIPPTREQDSR